MKMCSVNYEEEEEDDFLIRYDVFKRWLAKRGFIPSKYLQIARFKETGRGMLSTRNLEIGETVVSIPESILVTTDTVLNCSTLGPLIKSYGDEGPSRPRLAPLHVMVTFLMCERLNGPHESSWGPYLAVLPSAYTTPLFFPTNQIRLFQSHVQKRIRGLKETLKWEYERIRPFLLYLSRWYGTEVVRFQLFRWAWFTVNTRAVYLKSKRHSKCPFLNEEVDCCALAPFLDFLNHSSRVRVKAGLNESTGTYDIITLDPISAHDQVFINYGSHDNLTLLLDYGFVLANNPNSSVEFQSSEIIDSFERVLEGSDSLRKMLETGETIKDLSCTWDGPSWNLLKLLERWLGMTESVNPNQKSYEIVTKQLLQDLMSKRLKMTTESKNYLDRHPVSLASMMSRILMVEEMDILNLHLSSLLTN